MQVEIIPAMVQQLRETMEGNVGASWITDGKVAGLAAMTAHNAYHLGAIKQIAQIAKKLT